MPLRLLADLPIQEWLALNNANARETSHLEEAQASAMLDTAFAATAVRDGGLAAFLIAFDQEAPYRSPNFLWFRERYPSFVYVDRVITAAHARGRGHARSLYADLFRRAGAAGHRRVTCEINLVPPNPGSDAFHAALGFVEVGRAVLADGVKTVRYMSRDL